MNELSLFSGAGLGQWATKHLLGWRCLGYVEWDKYCQQVLRARIDDGLFDAAPIFGDIRQFILSGAAEQYRGFIDVVTAGFPCQSFSTAGAMLGSDDHRNMWPATAECLSLIRPQFALLENVPTLINSGYFEQILGDLAEMGMDAIWGVFSACATGAPHTRERLFVLAYATGERSNRRRECERSQTGVKRRVQRFGIQSGNAGTEFVQTSIWDTTAAEVLRVADGNTHRGHRVKAAGNGQVPAVVATAWNTLIREIGSEP